MNEAQQAFIAQMYPYALEASNATGVDPRIIIAQSAQETGWGRSAPNFNFFGIKSHGQPGGAVLSTTEVGPSGAYTANESFRRYGSMGESVQDYANFINRNPRYEPFRTAQGLDAQLAALQGTGYATDPNYARSVGNIARSINFEGLQAGAPAAQPRQAPVDKQPAPVYSQDLGTMARRAANFVAPNLVDPAKPLTPDEAKKQQEDLKKLAEIERLTSGANKGFLTLMQLGQGRQQQEEPMAAPQIMGGKYRPLPKMRGFL